MEPINLKSFLELKSIWKDEHMFELKIKATNCYFSGETEVYDQFESIKEFANKLIGYPKNSEILYYETGKKDSYSFFSMKFYPINQFGHIGVEINIESNVCTDYRPEEKNKLKLEIKVEPNAIDRFVNQLLHLAENQNGSAILYGNDNRIEF